MEDEPVDFTWFYFVGRNKLGFTFKEVGRLTLRKFNKMYQLYKNDFDMEMRMRNKNITYQELETKQMEDEEWF